MVALAFCVAIAAAIALIGAALVFRDGGSSDTSSTTPVIDFEGIPQSGGFLGNEDAKVTLIEYADVQCPACRRYAEEILPTVVAEYVRPGKVLGEFRGFPFLGPDSLKGQRFLLAAGEQDRLWQLADAMYRNQGDENSGWLTDDLLREMASEIPGLDVDELFARAESDELGQAAEQSAEDAQNAGITGTPTLIVKIGDGEPYMIAVATPDEMREALDDALSD